MSLKQQASSSKPRVASSSLESVPRDYRMSSPPIIALSSKLLEQIAETIRKRVLSGELIWPAHELIVWHIRADMQGAAL